MKCFLILIFCSNFVFSATPWKGIQNRYWQAQKACDKEQMLHYAQHAFSYAKSQAPRYLPLSCFYLGQAFIQIEHYSQAEYYLRQAWFFWRKIYGEKSLDALYALTLLEDVAIKRQHVQRAQYYRKQIKILLQQRAAPRPSHDS